MSLWLSLWPSLSHFSPISLLILSFMYISPTSFQPFLLSLHISLPYSPEWTLHILIWPKYGDKGGLPWGPYYRPLGKYRNTLEAPILCSTLFLPTHWPRDAVFLNKFLRRLFAEKNPNQRKVKKRRRSGLENMCTKKTRNTQRVCALWHR